MHVPWLVAAPLLNLTHAVAFPPPLSLDLGSPGVLHRGPIGVCRGQTAAEKCVIAWNREPRARQRARQCGCGLCCEESTGQCWSVDTNIEAALNLPSLRCCSWVAPSPIANVIPKTIQLTMVRRSPTSRQAACLCASSTPKSALRQLAHHLREIHANLGLQRQPLTAAQREDEDRPSGCDEKRVRGATERRMQRRGRTRRLI